ncbi:MAG: hypothetical protein LUH05_03120 [Candidatus Gastranaerophilales bacterium]|nr:hypothetical protein [Candidatus Gastranaerophilales bacterium]
MDISGVDIDNLSDEEILELCSDIVDCSSEEISILNGVDVNNLSDDKVQEIYDDVMYGNNYNQDNNIQTDEQILDISKDIVDTEDDEIILLGGLNLNLANLSDDEIMGLYNDVIDNSSVLIAASKPQDTKEYKCTSFKKSYSLDTDPTYGSNVGIYMYCANTIGGGVNMRHCQYAYTAKSGKCNAFLVAEGKGNCYFKCTGYFEGRIKCVLSSKYSYDAPYSVINYRYMPYRCK